MTFSLNCGAFIIFSILYNCMKCIFCFCLFPQIVFLIYYHMTVLTSINYSASTIMRQLISPPPINCKRTYPMSVQTSLMCLPSPCMHLLTPCTYQLPTPCTYLLYAPTFACTHPAYLRTYLSHVLPLYISSCAGFFVIPLQHNVSVAVSLSCYCGSCFHLS